MKRINLLCSPIVLQADYFSRIRPSDINDGYQRLSDKIIIFSGIIIFFIILIIAGIYVWKEHSKTVKSIGKIIFVCLCLYLVLAVGNWIYHKLKHQGNDRVETIDSVQQVISSVPVRIGEDDYSESQADAWATYPPAKGVASSQFDNDWLVAVTNKPSYRIYDLMIYAGMTPDNTQFLSEEDYRQSNWVRKHYTPEELHLAYIKLSEAWKSFMRCKYADINSPEIGKYMMHYDMFDIDKPEIEDANNPQLIKDLQCIPLQN